MRGQTGRGGQRFLVRRAELKQMRDAAAFLQFMRHLVEFMVMRQHDRRRIAQDEVQLVHGQSRIQRHENRSQPEAGELDFQDVGRIGRQHSHAVATLDAERAQMRCQPVDPLVERAVGQAPLCRQIDQRGLVAAYLGVVGDPVEIGETHG